MPSLDAEPRRGEDFPSPPYASDNAVLPQPDADELYDDAPQGGRRKGVLTVAAVFCLAVVGTASAFGYRTWVNGPGVKAPPPVIKASADPRRSRRRPSSRPMRPPTTASATAARTRRWYRAKRSLPPRVRRWPRQLPRRNTTLLLRRPLRRSISQVRPHLRRKSVPRRSVGSRLHRQPMRRYRLRRTEQQQQQPAACAHALRSGARRVCPGDR